MRFVVPTGAVGVDDLTGRTYTEFMGESLGCSHLVENKPGADATFGLIHVVKTKTDGLTLQLGCNIKLAINPFLLKQFPYDPHQGLLCVDSFGHKANVLAVRNNQPVDNFVNFIDLARHVKSDMTYVLA